jgi:NADH dehydrogenase/NADH:ubiquinone oxidoreductase subunit G
MYKIGALTSKVAAFKGRPWELKYVPSLDLNDTLGSKLLLNVKGRKVFRAVPSYNTNLQIEWVSDKSRYLHEAYSKHRLSWSALKVGSFYKKVHKYSYVQTLIKNWMAFVPFFDIVVGAKTDFQTLTDLKILGRSLGADLKTERPNFLSKTFNANYISNKNLKELDIVENCVFLGLNLKNESPVSNLIFRLRYLMGNFKCVLFGNATDFNFQLKNYGSKSLVCQDYVYGKHNIKNSDKNNQSNLIVYGDSCSERNDCLSWLKLFLKVFGNKSSLIRLSTQVGSTSQDYLNYEVWDDKNHSYFIIPLYPKSTRLIKNKNSLMGSTHLQEFIKNSDFFYPIPSYLEKNTSFLGYDGKLNYAYKAMSPFTNSLNNVKDILVLSTHQISIKKTFKDWKKTSLNKYLISTSANFKTKNSLVGSLSFLKLIKSPYKTYYGNSVSPHVSTKISSTLMQVSNHQSASYFSFL